METKVKVAFLNKYQNKHNRGAETFVYEVSRRLKKDFAVDVVSDVNYLKFLKMKYDIIVPTNGREQVLMVKIICLIRGAKMIISGQSGPGADDKWNLLMFPNRFVALTDYQKKWAERFNPFVKVVKIPNGVDLSKFNEKVKPIEVNLPKPIVLTVGALEDIKRQELIIKAVSKTKASLLIVGKGKLENYLNKLGSKYLNGRFIIRNFSYEEMNEVYGACDLFTYATRPEESFGIVMVEAMASGLAVAATNDPIRREIVGNAGLFVDPTETDKYAEKIDEALKKKWGNTSRKQAGKFDWGKIAESYKNLINEICK